MDLGGGSTQIVFEPQVDPLKEMPPGEHRYELEFGGKQYVLYQHSYLGYGLIQARKQISQLVLDSMKGQRLSNPKKRTSDSRVHHPCMATNHTEVVMLDGETEPVTLYGTSLQRKCKILAQKILKKDQLCPLPPCGFAGIYQPKVFDLPKDQTFYAFSFFFDRVSPLVGGAERVTIGELGRLTELVCTGRRTEFEFMSKDALKEIDTNPAYCLDLSYMYALLSFGYEFPDDREIRLIKKIKGVETGWCLGAAFALLDSKV
jgi:guanosine-diphosphatase